jgi:hypothetical protein
MSEEITRRDLRKTKMRKREKNPKYKNTYIFLGNTYIEFIFIGQLPG